MRFPSRPLRPGLPRGGRLVPLALLALWGCGGAEPPPAPIEGVHLVCDEPDVDFGRVAGTLTARDGRVFKVPVQRRRFHRVRGVEDLVRAARALRAS